MSYDPDNVFARILRHEIPCTTVFEDAYALAFHDIAPQAPVHVLVIPKGAYESLMDFGVQASAEEITGFWRAVATVAQKLGLNDDGFRMIGNCGENAGQEVPHFHVHLLGGARLGSILPQKP